MKTNHRNRSTINKNNNLYKKPQRWNVLKYYSYLGKYEHATLTK